MMKLQNKRSLSVNNYLATLVIIFSFLNGLVGINGISIVNIVLIFCLCIWSKKKGTFRITKRFCLCIGYVFLLLVLSFLRLAFVNMDLKYLIEYFSYFVCFDILALAVGFQDFEYMTVIKNVVIIGSFGLIGWVFKDWTNSADTSGSVMGYSYGILPVLFVSIIGFFKSRKVRLLALINVIVIAYLYISYAPRGVYLVVLFFCLCLLLVNISNSKKIINQFLQKLLFVSVLILISWYIVSNLYEIINYASVFLKKTFNITVYAFEKYLKYFKMGDISNGRNDLANVARKVIEEKVLLGGGIGYLENFTGVYSHNIFLQSFCEFGVLLFIPICFVYFLSFKQIMSYSYNKRKEIISFSVFTVTNGFFPLLYSSAYWLYIPFWFSLGQLLKSRDGEKYGEYH